MIIIGNVDIRSNEWRQVKDAAIAMEESMRTSRIYCLVLQSMIRSASWKGATRNQFETYIALIEQYHKELTDILGEQTKALKDYEVYRSNFKHDVRVKSVKNL